MGELVLLIGSGGREHALAWKLSQSNLIDKIFVAPGNAGTSTVAKVSNVDLNVKDFESISNWCRSNNITFVIVGPEDPLAAGIVDFLTGTGIPTFGPTASAAKIESDKSFAKHFMVRHGIPTARFKSFTEPDEACKYIVNADFAALVVKASGLAAGKGVVVASSQEGACEAVREMMTDKKYGAAGDVVVVEELLEGPEVSVLAFTDGISVHVMPPAQDHKRLLEKDEGPNTGGMGAICPYPGLTPTDLDFIQKEVLEKTVSGMAKEGNKYSGVLYAGLMITKDGPKVLEFNCRFGDPETQSILLLMTSDLLPTLKACVSGNLKQASPSFDTSRTAVGVVVVSGGYPDGYRKGLKISGIDEVERNGVRVFHAGTSQDAEGQVVTSGGRVLAVVATESTAILASQRATTEAAKVQFEGAYYRKDIGHKSFKRSSRESTPTVTDDQGGLRYKDAGVDIIAGDYLVNAIKPLAKMTRRSGCDADLGGFGGIFDLSAPGLNKSVLTCRTWGVGPKLKLAESLGHHYNIGFDLLAQCVNELITLGAEPIFVLDYYATGKLNVPCAEEVVRGIAEGCLEAGCALIGRHISYLPSIYSGNIYDLGGFSVGVVEKSKMMTSTDEIQAGDAVIGLPSSGLHSNGFSLVRKVVELHNLRFDMPCPFDKSVTLGKKLLTPTEIYVKSVLPALHSGKVKGFAHITGGGLTENIPRVLPSGSGVRLDASSWEVPPVFGWLQYMGKINDHEMARTFNCGLGAVLIVSKSHVTEVLAVLSENQAKARVVGSVVSVPADSEKVVIDNLRTSLLTSWPRPKLPERKKKVGVLISGSGTNLQALIDHTQNKSHNSAAEITLVVSNKADVAGLTRAQRAGIKTLVIKHEEYKSRKDFDAAVHEQLVLHGIDIVCLAGFMRILTGEFVDKWTGRMLNIHPSLLPSFKGAHAQKLAIEAGVRISGCSIHFVSEEVDGGALIAQESVPVYPGDTEATLAERIKTVEHIAYPKALELLASERIQLGTDGKIVWNW
ncbi:unnamed protein product [Lymnaea stagnalis]|uniref:Trifunctional purine biosynthetic protein adenosine-3 n=1 Tax=Lymnaea stagnalis TaxID=6523 RepID=A0AAV2H0U1_LYMST